MLGRGLCQRELHYFDKQLLTALRTRKLLKFAKVQRRSHISAMAAAEAVAESEADRISLDAFDIIPAAAHPSLSSGNGIDRPLLAAISQSSTSST